VLAPQPSTLGPLPQHTTNASPADAEVQPRGGKKHATDDQHNYTSLHITTTSQLHHNYTSLHITTTSQLHHNYTSLHIKMKRRITPAIYIKAPPPSGTNANYKNGRAGIPGVAGVLGLPAKPVNHTRIALLGGAKGLIALDCA